MAAAAVGDGATLGAWVAAAGVAVGVAGSIVGTTVPAAPEPHAASATAQTSATTMKVLAVAALTGSLRVHVSMAKVVRLAATVAPTRLQVGK